MFHCVNMFITFYHTRLPYAWLLLDIGIRPNMKLNVYVPLPSQKMLKISMYILHICYHTLFLCLCVVQANSSHCPPFSEFMNCFVHIWCCCLMGDWTVKRLLPYTGHHKHRENQNLSVLHVRFKPMICLHTVEDSTHLRPCIIAVTYIM